MYRSINIIKIIEECHAIAQGLWFSDAKDLDEGRIVSVPRGAKCRWGSLKVGDFKPTFRYYIYFISPIHGSENTQTHTHTCTRTQAHKYI